MENRDQRKSQLENAISSASKAIEGQLGDYKDKGKNLLIVGGIVVAAYALTKLFTDDEDELPQNDKKQSSFLGSALTGMLTTVLLTLAKNKILEIIEQLNQNEENIK